MNEQQITENTALEAFNASAEYDKITHIDADNEKEAEKYREALVEIALSRGLDYDQHEQQNTIDWFCYDPEKDPDFGEMYARVEISYGYGYEE